MPSTSVSPTAHDHRDDRPFPLGERDDPRDVDRLDDRGAAAVEDDLPLCRQLGRRPADIGPTGAERGIVPLDDLPPLVAGVGENARDLEHRELLHQQDEEDDAHEQKDDREPHGQQRHLSGAAAVDPGEGGQRVEERRDEDAERVAHHGRTREPRDQSRRVGGGAELHHHEGQGEHEAGEGERPRGDRREHGGGRPDADRGREVRQEGGLEPGQGEAEDHRACGVDERRADRTPEPVGLRTDVDHGFTSRFTPPRSRVGARTSAGRRAYTRGRSSTTGRGLRVLVRGPT